MADGRKTIRFTLNGRPATADVAPHENLIEMLQRDFARRGARVSCAQGLCGCCTVAVNGIATSGCLFLAPFAVLYLFVWLAQYYRLVPATPPHSPPAAPHPRRSRSAPRHTPQRTRPHPQTSKT